MRLSEKHREYWRKNLILTGLLLAIWFLVTFLPATSPANQRTSSFWLPVRFLHGAPRER